MTGMSFGKDGRGMEPQLQSVATEALSSALVDVGTRQFDRLRAGMSTEQAAKRVDDALEQLQGLQAGAMPDYDDPWVALLYVLWYQPSQINLAYSTISNALDDTRRRVQIVDFGAGALAAQFGAALHLLEAERDVAVSVQSIDPSRAMIEIGEEIWQSFVEAVRDQDVGMYESCKSIEGAVVTANDVTRKRRAYQMLSAFHVVYKENKAAVAEALGDLRVRLRPDVKITTTHRRVGWMASEVAGPTGPPVETGPKFTGDLPRVTELRKEIWRSIGRPSTISAGYLNNAVSWDWPKAAIFIAGK